jgi:hypothetical protein
MLIYAGIGSRKTPIDKLGEMREIATYLAKLDWILRSGHAQGADMAFEEGCIAAEGKKEIYLPWNSFNGAYYNELYGYFVPPMTTSLMQMAAAFHPCWERCSYGARKMHARNGCQILGKDLKTLATMVVCWTEGGLGGGGTGQAIRIANYYGIPVFDLATKDCMDRLTKFIELTQK